MLRNMAVLLSQGSGVTGDVVITSCTWVAPSREKVQSFFSAGLAKGPRALFHAISGEKPELTPFGLPKSARKEETHRNAPRGAVRCMQISANWLEPRRPLKRPIHEPIVLRCKRL